jgi:hypothetical protein
VPAGAVAEAGPPVPALDHAPSEPGSPYLLDVARWWSLPVSMTDGLAWVQAHSPSGLRFFAHGSGSGADGAFSYIAYADAPTAAYTEPTLVIEVVPRGEGESAMRADGQTLWVPLRPPAERVPSDVTAVQLRATRDGKGLAHRTITGSATATLVRLANALHRDNRGTVSCLADTGFRISATFLSPERTLVFTEDPACFIVSVKSKDEAFPALLDITAFLRATRSDLHLPR